MSRYLVVLIKDFLKIGPLVTGLCIHFNGFCVLKLHAFLIFIPMSCSLPPSISCHGVYSAIFFLLDKPLCNFIPAFPLPDLLQALFSCAVTQFLYCSPYITAPPPPSQLCPSAWASSVWLVDTFLPESPCFCFFSELHLRPSLGMSPFLI